MGDIKTQIGGETHSDIKTQMGDIKTQVGGMQAQLAQILDVLHSTRAAS